MADKSVEKRTKLWTKRGGSIRYRWHERLGDWWCASRDAKAGTPATPVPPEPGSPGLPSIALGTTHADGRGPTRWGTPRTVALGQLARARAEREWVLFQADAADLQIDRAQAEARCKTATALLASKAAELTEAEQQPDDKAPTPAPGEESAPVDVIRSRRAAEHEARLQKLRSQRQQAQDTIDEAVVAMARLDEQIRIRRAVAEVRVAMIEAYVRCRCSAYLNRLLRTHPDGKRLGSLVRSDWTQRPSWLHDGSTATDGGA
jgi:hypothetical protein